MTAQTKELVGIKDISMENAPAIYGVSGLDVYYEAAKDSVDEVPDLTTSKGRKRVASLSAQVSSSKTGVVAKGKEYLREIKARPKLIQDELNAFTVKMDALRDSTRKPLSDWEDEQKKIAADNLAAEQAAEVAIQKELDQEFGVLMNDKFDLEAREEAEAEAFRQKQAAEEQERADEQFRVAQENARIEREDRIKKEAAEKAEADKEAAIVRQQAAEQAVIDTEKRRVEQEAQAVIDIAAAAEKARLDEIASQLAGEELKRRELERLEANTRHVGKIRRQIKESMMGLGLTEEMAIKVVKAIVKNTLGPVFISYQ